MKNIKIFADYLKTEAKKLGFNSDTTRVTVNNIPITTIGYLPGQRTVEICVYDFEVSTENYEYPLSLTDFCNCITVSTHIDVNTKIKIATSNSGKPFDEYDRINFVEFIRSPGSVDHYFSDTLNVSDGRDLDRVNLIVK